MHQETEQLESGAGERGEKMKRVLTVTISALVLSGCSWFLPPGTPPEGNIVDNIPQGIADTIMDYRSAVDYYINELVRETMLHCAGEEVFIDADRSTERAAGFVLSKSGELSGVKAGNAAQKKPRLISRYIDGKHWQMELLSSAGKSLWKRTITIRK